MSFLTIDSTKCKKDGLCAGECPLMLIEINPATSIPEAVTDAGERCLKCGHCVAICPHAALSVAGIDIQDCIPLRNDLLLSEDHLRQLIKSRRSVRKFQDKIIEQEKLSRLIDIARYAPTGGNSQQVQWLVFNSPVEVKKIAAATIDFMKGLINKNHPMVEKYNLHRMVNRWDSGVDGILRGAPALIVAYSPKQSGLATIDGTIALSYLDIAAAAFGLGCCWAGFFMIASSQSPEVLKILNLPEGNVCTGGLMIGYPKYIYHRIPPRREANIVWRP
jgi:nitroreductase/NAD-dependent dihydropyrimidine dehydrogenase PreA subunit